MRALLLLETEKFHAFSSSIFEAKGNKLLAPGAKVWLAQFFIFFDTELAFFFASIRLSTKNYAISTTLPVSFMRTCGRTYMYPVCIS